MLLRHFTRFFAALLLAAMVALWVSSFFRTLILRYDGVHAPFIMSTRNKFWLGYIHDPVVKGSSIIFNTDPPRIDTYDESYNASLHRFLGFAWGTTSGSYSSASLAIPYWFLTVIFSGLLYWFWRKTHRSRRGFPIEVSASVQPPQQPGA